MSARERFVAVVVQLGGSLAAAELLDCSRGYINMIKAGKRRPGLALARRIEIASGGEITMRAWMAGS